MSLPAAPAPDDVPAALVLGGAHGALAIVRSLARRGIAVSVLADHRLAHFSRYLRGRFAWDGPNAPGALDRLIALADRNHLAGAVLFAGGDAEVRFIAQNHAALARVFRLTTPAWDMAKEMLDKRLMHVRAAAAGLDAPRCHAPADRHAVGELACRFPVVLKPRVRAQENTFTLAKAWRADDRETLLARYDEAAALVGADGVLLQEWIPGGGEAQFSYAAVCDRGAPLAALVARRRRQYPIDFGYTSTFVETALCPEVEDAGRRFLAALGFTGLAEVEFKYDRRDGRYKILDVNPRIWTWAALGAPAGVDFPYLLWRLARGEPVEPVTACRQAAWMHASRDAIAAIEELLAGRLRPRDYLASLKVPLAFSAFALDDPLPGLIELPLALLRAATHRLPIVLRDFFSRIVLADSPRETCDVSAATADMPAPDRLAPMRPRASADPAD
ncbi:MAG TPA: ATP-grasp domain-containing protein [Xanthobacteraceae bacterium]|nr:ATP-grasp domain-containing protein [Xanthobacteraceae bacterium]